MHFPFNQRAPRRSKEPQVFQQPQLLEGGSGPQHRSSAVSPKQEEEEEEEEEAEH